MKVIRAGVLGFCMGVSRAVEMAEAEAKHSDGQRVYALGPLIHNPRVLSDLKKLGVEIIDEPPQNPCCVIIRAHGISPVVEKKLRGSGCRIVDATCPRVKASQLKAEELECAGYCLFLAGEADHAEIESIMGYTGSDSSCAIVCSSIEAERAAAKFYKANNNAKTALLGQSTISEDEYFKIGEAIKIYFPNLEIINTICSATADRQQALRELLDQVDAVIIAGGKESANTRRLLAIAQDSGKPCVLIESSSEIPDAFRSFETVGICAGASTPDYVISEIEEELLGTRP
jgi:4-hydroxy-3-methylbut-2-enyl diphosphate reductase